MKRDELWNASQIGSYTMWQGDHVNDAEHYNVIHGVNRFNIPKLKQRTRDFKALTDMANGLDEPNANKHPLKAYKSTVIDGSLAKVAGNWKSANGSKKLTSSDIDRRNAELFKYSHDRSIGNVNKPNYRNNFGKFFDKHPEYNEKLNMFSGSQLKNQFARENLTIVDKYGSIKDPSLKNYARSRYDVNRMRMNEIDPNKAYTGEMMGATKGKFAPVSRNAFVQNVKLMRPHDKNIHKLLNPPVGKNRIADTFNITGQKTRYYLMPFNKHQSSLLFKDNDMIASRGKGGKFKYDNGHVMNVPSGNNLYNPFKLTKPDYHNAVKFYRRDENIRFSPTPLSDDAPIKELEKRIRLNVYSHNSKGFDALHKAKPLKPARPLDKPASWSDLYGSVNNQTNSDVKYFMKDYRPKVANGIPNGEGGNSSNWNVDKAMHMKTRRINTMPGAYYTVGTDARTNKVLSKDEVNRRGKRFLENSQQYQFAQIMDKPSLVHDKPKNFFKAKMHGLNPEVKSAINHDDFKYLKKLKSNVEKDISVGRNKVSRDDVSYLNARPSIKTRLNVKTAQIRHTENYAVYTRDGESAMSGTPYSLKTLDNRINKAYGTLSHAISHEGKVHDHVLKHGKIRGLSHFNAVLRQNSKRSSRIGNQNKRHQHRQSQFIGKSQSNNQRRLSQNKPKARVTARTQSKGFGE